MYKTTKRIEKEFTIEDHKFNSIDIRIYYSKKDEAYLLDIMPVHLENVITYIAPHLIITEILIDNIKKKSDIKQSEVIKIYNSRLVKYQKDIKNLFNIDISIKELIV